MTEATVMKNMGRRTIQARTWLLTPRFLPATARMGRRLMVLRCQAHTRLIRSRMLSRCPRLRLGTQKPAMTAVRRSLKMRLLTRTTVVPLM